MKPFTLIEKSEIFKGTTDNDLTVLIDVIVKKALTKDGDKMFDLEAKIKMKRFVDPDIIGRIATQIMGNSEDTNTLKKNYILTQICDFISFLQNNYIKLLVR